MPRCVHLRCWRALRCARHSAASLRACFLSLVLCAICSFPLAAPLLHLQLPRMTGIGRRHISSSAPASPSAAKPPKKLPASLRRSERVIFVQRAGAKGSAKLVTSAADVGDLVKDIKTELPSLLDARLDSITLQLAAKDKDGKVTLVPLGSMDTIAEALTKASAVLGRDIAPTEKLRIVVDVEGAAAPGTGTCTARALCVIVR